MEFSREFGSGYPADPFTKQWLEGSLDKLFGYPTLIRFSWATTDNMLEDHDDHANVNKALADMQQVAAYIEKKKEEAENIYHIMAIQDSLVGKFNVRVR